MLRQKQSPLNRLEHELPEGLLVDAPWLKQRGYSRQLLNHYVHAGWLEQPTRGVYRRPRGSLKWEQAVIALQTLMNAALVVGGRTALELQGYAHYLPHETKEVHLYGPNPPPSWLRRLALGVRFVLHNSNRLFDDEPGGDTKQKESGAERSDTINQPWGQWDWTLTLSSPERAVLELLDELPMRESFDQADKLFEGLSNLSPRRLQALLKACKSVKVKRLFFFFAGRHQHAWLRRLDRGRIDLGAGKRVLVKGGKLDPATQMTVPGDLDGVR
jgi:hypothetical protein